MPMAEKIMSKISSRDVTATYRFYAPYYDRLFGMVLEQGRTALAEKVRKIKPENILEIGVGTGLTFGHYPKNASIVGIDISPEMLEKARHKAKRMPERDIQLFLMDAENLDFPDQSFECVTLPYVLSVTPDPQRLIREARRVCKPEGNIVILNHFNGSNAWWLLEKMVKPLASRIGFHSDFRFEDHLLGHDWEISSIDNANLFNLSKVVTIKNSKTS